MRGPEDAAIYMFQHLRTLRFRLAALYLVVFGVIQVAVCAVILHAFASHVRQDFDERLIDRAEIMIDAISVETAQPSPTPQRRSPPRLNPFRFPGYYFQIVGDSGRTLERSWNLGETSLPFTETARASRRAGRPAMETIRDEVGRASSAATGQLRLLTLFRDEPNVRPFYLQIAASLEPVSESITQARRLLFTIVPIGLAAAALASWLLARRSLAPIGRIARQAREYTGASLERRIDMPPGNDEAAELAAVINEMLGRLESAFHAQSRFVADASHELKTPLSVLSAEAQILSQQPRSPEQYERFVASIRDELRQLSRLVDSLLTLARAEAGAPLAATMPVSINEVAMDTVQRYQGLAEQRSIKLAPTLAMPGPAGPEPVVDGDPALLRAMAENLVRNAIRHSPRESAVQIEVGLDGQHVSLAVRDRGPGIPSDQIEKIFDAFYRVPPEDQPHEGSGLGLAIARSVTRLHHGSIAARNHPEGGCEFVVRLPLRGPEESAPD